MSKKKNEPCPHCGCPNDARKGCWAEDEDWGDRLKELERLIRVLHEMQDEILDVSSAQRDKLETICSDHHPDNQDSPIDKSVTDIHRKVDNVICVNFGNVIDTLIDEHYRIRHQLETKVNGET